MSEFLHVEIRDIEFSAGENLTPLLIKLLPLCNRRDISCNNYGRVLLTATSIEVACYFVSDKHENCLSL